jgi:hypothetical protein
MPNSGISPVVNGYGCRTLAADVTRFQLKSTLSYVDARSVGNSDLTKSDVAYAA